MVSAFTSLSTSQPYSGKRRLLRREGANPFPSPGCLGSMGLSGSYSSLHQQQTQPAASSATPQSVSLRLSVCLSVCSKSPHHPSLVSSTCTWHYCMPRLLSLGSQKTSMTFSCIHSSSLSTGGHKTPQRRGN